jgi:hypothetical protein
VRYHGPVIDAHSKTWRIGLPLVLACGVVVAWSCSGGPADDAGSAGPGPRELTGTWSGELSHNAQTAPFAIRFDTTEEGDLEALVSIPDSDLWEASFGEATIEENEIRIGSWAAQGNLGADRRAVVDLRDGRANLGWRRVCRWSCLRG